MGSSTRAFIPGGVLVDGKIHRDAELRRITGEDELSFVERERSSLNVHRVNELLSKCLTRIGPIEQVTPDVVRSLTIGDREALLLQLRRLEIGDRLDGIVRCPFDDCGEKMDLSLNVNDLLLPPYDSGWPPGEANIRMNGREFTVRFRLPTGGDQEDASILHLSDPVAARDLILRRCILEIVPNDGEGQVLEDLSPGSTDLLSSILLENDPQAELRLDIHCPECGHVFSTIFDVAGFLLEELELRSGDLIRKVHTLAYHYHWSEKDILSMDTKRRNMYLEMLSDEISRRRRG